MRKLALLSLSVILLFSLAACSSPSQFDGSRTGNDSRLVMEYTILNTTDSQELVLAEGDTLAVDIVSESGSVSISIQKDGEASIYEGNGVPTSSFEVGVPEAGTYTCSVTGKQAKGSVSVVKVED